MIVKNSSKENNTVTFNVELDPAEFEVHVNNAYRKNRSRIQVPGFRRGKASRMVIEGMYGKDVFYEEAAEDAANEAFTYGVQQESLRPVGGPSLVNIQFTEEKGAVLSFRTDVWPEATLGQYKGLEAERDECVVTDEEVDAEIELLRKQNSRIVSVDRPAENGDTVNIDYTGTKDGVPFDGGVAQGYDLKLGSNSFIPGFEEKLVGISADEERDLELTFPAEYHARELAGQNVVFHVKCNTVKYEELPEVDDEFAKDNDFDTVAELRQNAFDRLMKSKATVADNAFTDRLIAAASDNMTVEIPDGLVEEQMDTMTQDYARYISNQGIPFEQYLKMMGMDANAFRETTRSTATTQARTSVLLDAVIKAENLQVSDDDIQAEIQKMADDYKMKTEDVEKIVSKDLLKEDLLRRKATAVIFESGIPVPPKAPQAKETPAETGVSAEEA